jgi:linearmycin/streptolysin S transport system ATP-binding protein
MKIELHGLVKSYRHVLALDHVSLQIEPGQIVSLPGPNGAGKTILLRCLYGIAAPDKGRVYFDEREFRREQLDLRRRMHLLPDFPFLFWEQSVLRNIAIVPRVFEADHSGAEERVLDRVCVIHKGAIHAFDTLDRLRERASDKGNVLEEMFRQLRQSGQ